TSSATTFAARGWRALDGYWKHAWFLEHHGAMLKSASQGLLAPMVFTHGVIPGSCHTKVRRISSPGIDKGPPHGALQSWTAAMEHYVGLDVSLKLTAICIVDRTGKIEREGVVASNPEAIAAFIKSHAPHVAR